MIGDKRLERKFNKLENKVAKKVLRTASKEAMEPVATMARVRAPVKSGRLKASIKVLSYSARRGQVTGARVVTGTRKQLRIKPDAPGYYPAAHEYGAPSINIPMKSFLRSSLSDLRSSVVSNLGRLLKKHVDRI